jgi:hypothetical protein
MKTMVNSEGQSELHHFGPGHDGRKAVQSEQSNFLEDLLCVVHF